MSGKMIRTAIVGASSLLGKELASELVSSERHMWDLKLLDAVSSDNAGGTFTAAGEEALLVTAIGPSAFDGIDVAFFTVAEDAKRYWKTAAQAGAIVVDLSGTLAGEAGAAVCSSWSIDPSAKTRVIVSAHPAAIMLLALLLPLRATWPGTKLFATVMEPASQLGSAGVDELQQQTTALLSFQSLPQLVYGGQAAFNLYSVSPAEAKAKLADICAHVRADVAAVVGAESAGALSMQFVQAPVFHGYTASVFVQTDAELAAIASVLDGPAVRIVSDEESPGNVSATEQGQIFVSLQDDKPRGVWLWAACDNIKLAAQNAIACALSQLS